MFADWLTQQGDPRGELIAVQHALGKRSDDAALRAAEAELLRDHRLSPGLPARDLAWHDGFIRGARMSDATALCDLIRHPSARFLHDLWLVDRGLFEQLVLVLDLGYHELVAAAAPPLRRLVIAAEPAVNLRLVKYPRLEHLEVDAMQLWVDVLPPLRSLHVRVQRMDGGLRAAIVRMPGVALAELEIVIDDAARFAPLFARTDLLALRTLRLRGLASDAIHELVRAPFTPALETLEIVGPLSTAARRALLHCDRFASLQRLHLGEDKTGELAAAFGPRLRLEPVPRPFLAWPRNA